MYSTYHMEYETFIEAICITAIQTWEKLFAATTFKGMRDAPFKTEQGSF